jgi:hypothetical protein
VTILWIVLEIIDDGLQDFIIGRLAAVENLELMLQHKQQPVDVAMLFKQNLNDVRHRSISAPCGRSNKIVNER